MSERELKPNSKWRHFKGGLYLVIDVARHSEDPNQEFVVYKHLEGSNPKKDYGDDQLWIRPKEMFLEKVTRDNKTFWRFEKVEN